MSQLCVGDGISVLVRLFTFVVAGVVVVVVVVVAGVAGVAVVNVVVDVVVVVVIFISATLNAFYFCPDVL